MMNSKKIKELYFFHPKSKIKAGDGIDDGKYPFYTSSPIQSKWLNDYQFNTRAIILGTGGKASLHFADGAFSVSTDCFALSTKQEEVNIEYTYYYLNSQFHLIERGFKGAGLKHISKDYVESIEIKYPDLETQNKIVSILYRAKALLDKRKNVIVKYNELLRATFLDMFGDPCNPSRSDLTPLSEVIIDIEAGWSPVCEETPRANPNQKAILKQSAVTKRYFDPEQNKLLPEGLAIKKAVYAKNSDLLFSRKNTPELVGSTAYVFGDYEDLLLPDTIFNLRYNRENDSGVYLYFLFNNKEFRRKIQSLSVGQAKSMSNISQERLLKLEIPRPDFKRQKEFETIVLKSYHSFYKKCLESKSKFELLLKSLSQQAFSARVNIDVDIELEALLNTIDPDKKDEENSVATIKNDLTLLQRLIDKLKERDFENGKLYDKAIYIIFRIMKEEPNLIKQKFDPTEKKITLEL